MPAVPGARPRAFVLLSAQFSDGFGGRFHGVLLGLYALHLGGLDGFAGYVAASLVGSGLSAVAAGWLTSRLGGGPTMRLAGGSLIAARLASYLLVPFGLPLAGLLALRLLGSVSGTLVNTGSKAQVPEGAGATTSLAWMHVSNGGGQAVAAIAAGLLSAGSPWAVAGLGGTVAVASALPMLRLARYAAAEPVPLRDQLRGLRIARTPIVLGAVVFLVLNALPNLGDGITTQHYSAAWLGPLSAAALAGAVAAATVLPWMVRRAPGADRDAVVWAALAALGVAGWAAVDRGVFWLLLARFAAGFAAQALAALVEARVLERAGRAMALPALSASSAIAAFGGAGAAAALPLAIGRLGYAATAAGAVLLLVAVAATATLAVRQRGRRAAGGVATATG